MIKTAYDIGVEQALQEAGLEKAAWVQAAATGAGLLSRIAGWGSKLFGAGRAAATASKAAPAASSLMNGVRAGGGWMNSVIKPAISGAEGVKGFMPGLRESASAVGNAFQNGGVLKGLGAAAKSPLGKEMLIGGGLNGALSAATAKPGERGEAALKGFGYGAAGGAVFKGVHSLGSNAIKTAPIAAARNQGGMKGFGMKALTSPTLLATGASMAMPTGDKKPNLGGVPGMIDNVQAPGLPMSNLPGM